MRTVGRQTLRYSTICRLLSRLGLISRVRSQNLYVNQIRIRRSARPSSAGYSSNLKQMLEEVRYVT